MASFAERRATKQLLKTARKRPGDPLSAEDWAAYFDLGRRADVRRYKSMLRALPSSPRCGFCGAPFAGIGGRILRPLGYRPSRKNPNMCDVCVEMAPPGGMTAHLGVLFADIRGFTALAEGADPHATSALLRRFYGCAERTLLPEAIIDKLIGDEVMALYVPAYMRPQDPVPTGDAAAAAVAPVMLDHARSLLAAVGYGTDDGPFLEVGVGLDYGEAFVGNVGQGTVRDFTAIGDVVNTASRLTGHAGGGEIVLSARLAHGLTPPPGDATEITVKGKAAPVAVHRVVVP